MDYSVWYLLLTFLYLVHNASAANGIIGFGISLYQDLCCQSCHDSLSSLYLNCTTFMAMEDDGSGMDMDMGDMSMMMGMTSDECYASNTPWLQTMAYCIQQNCNADGYPKEKQAECFSVHAVAGASEPTFEDSLPTTAPSEELADDATWLNVTSLVNIGVYYSTHGTLGEFTRSEYLHTRYSLILYLVVIGVCLVAGVSAQLGSALPAWSKRFRSTKFMTKLQQILFLPALFGSRRLEPLPGNIGYVPGRTLSLSIAIYVILNVVFSAVNFGSFSPNLWFASPEFELCEYVGNRTGTLSLVNITIAILFAGRNNILITLTGWSQTTFLTFHRWAARVATLQAVVHSIVYTLAYFEPGSDGASAYATEAAQPFYRWGIVGTIALCLAVSFAILPLRMRFYEIFLITHIVLVIIGLVACWYHLVPHFGFDYGYQVWLYIGFAFWFFDRSTRFVRIVYYNRMGKSKAVVEAIPGCDILQVTVFPRVAWAFGPGQHSFLYIPGLGRIWENHPFSIASWSRQGESMLRSSSSVSASDNDDSGAATKHSHAVLSTVEIGSHTDDPIIAEKVTPTRGAQHVNQTAIRFLVRVHSGATATLQRRILAPPLSPSLELSVYTEGPYAGHRSTLQPLLLAETVLCIAGGIGVTNALGFIQEFININRQKGEKEGRSSGILSHTKRFIFAWSTRELALIEYVEQNFLAGSDDIECSFWYTGHAETGAHDEHATKQEDPEFRSIVKNTGTPPAVGRMNVGNVIRSALEVGHQAAVVVCGPGGMADEVTKEVVVCVKDGFKVDLIEENFTW